MGLRLPRLIGAKLKGKDASPCATSKQLAQMACSGRVIAEEGISVRFVLKKLKKGMGFDLFLHPKTAPLAKGTLIAPYSGKVLLVPAAQDSATTSLAWWGGADLRGAAEFDPKNRYHPACRYVLDLDAEQEGNFTRFINHSEKPNVVDRMNKHFFLELKHET